MSAEGDYQVSPETSNRRLNPGAEKWLGVRTEVLDHGFVQLVNYMGDDRTVEEAARVSYGEGTRKVNETVGLIRYLRRHRHTTPFEMCELTFMMRMPISVARQLIRHRTASVNEYSSRYSVVPDEFYIPEPENVSVQASTNRQGRGSSVDDEYAQEIRGRIGENATRAYEEYRFILNDDGTGKPVDPNRPQIARETARDALTLNFYTEMYWKVDLHNMFHFLGLRMDEHAQWEIRQFANAIGNVVKDSFPICWKAFEDYEMYSTEVSRPEKELLSKLFEEAGVSFTSEQIISAADSLGFTNKRERGDFFKKMNNFGLLK